MKGFKHVTAPYHTANAKTNLFDFGGNGDCVLLCVYNSSAGPYIRNVLKVANYKEFHALVIHLFSRQMMDKYFESIPNAVWTRAMQTPLDLDQGLNMA
jgi:hypothetical protein